MTFKGLEKCELWRTKRSWDSWENFLGHFCNSIDQGKITKKMVEMVYS